MKLIISGSIHWAPSVQGERGLETIREFLQGLGMWQYQVITVNFVRCNNSILVMSEYIHFWEMLTEVYKDETTLFALKSE